MKVIRYYNEVTEEPLDDNWWGDRQDGFIMDNRNEPVVRVGGEPFEFRYDYDYCQWAHFICDPSRSFVRQVYAARDMNMADFWSFAQFVDNLARALGYIMDDFPGNAMIASFWTMFPFFLALPDFKERMYCKAYNNQVTGIVRVLNNPFFYCSSNVSDSRLVEIAQDVGFTYAVDLANPCGSAEALAREIALLNHIHEGDATVAEVYDRLLPQIADVVR